MKKILSSSDVSSNLVILYLTPMRMDWI